MPLHPNIAEIDNEVDIKPGTNFWEIYEGFTRTGQGQVSKIWEVMEYMGNDVYKCRPISDNTVGSINPNYTENFTEEHILEILTQTPIIQKRKY